MPEPGEGQQKNESKPFDENATDDFVPLQEYGPIEPAENILKRYRKEVKETIDPIDKSAIKQVAKDKIKRNSVRKKEMGQE